MSLDMHIWSCIRANSKYKVATTLHCKRRSSPRLPLPLGSWLGHRHHLVVVVKGKWWFTHLSLGLCRTLEEQIQLKLNGKCVFLLGVLKIIILIYCYLHLTADAKNTERSQKNWFSREKVPANELFHFFGKLLLTPNSCRKISKNTAKNQLFQLFRKCWWFWLKHRGQATISL